MTDNPLGSHTEHPKKYQPDVLYPIPRWASRSLLDIDKKIRMFGLDHWQAYELSWLNSSGKPQVAIGEFYFNCESENIVESKSLKLYLNSLNQERYKNTETMRSVIEQDLSSVSHSEVKVTIHSLDETHNESIGARAGRCIDHIDVELIAQQPDSELLNVVDADADDEVLYSDLFRSNCPVTGQPDWASIEIRYTGMKISESSLLKYLISFREHQSYHEDCAERIFRDIMLKCRPSELRVGMNFLRRGGLDINVYRSTAPVTSDSVNSRLIRQ
jgi:7-cyano-7-deazaguanine reductase|tara:strand:- start:460 stop:1278 length:819 start_codon:yes stop_codon:yes gene_type:complete